MTPTNLASVVDRLVSRSLPLVLLLLGSTLPACQGSGDHELEADYPPIVSSTFGEMRNVSVSGPIWFGGAPCRQDLELAERRGIERVIDLSSSSEVPRCDVSSTCKALGMEYLKAAAEGESERCDEAVDLVLGWLESGSARPTLMFDGTGGRCASFIAIHRAVAYGVPLEEALVEARRAGMKPGDPEEFVRDQVERLTTAVAHGASN